MADIKVTSFADIEPVELEAVWQGIVLAGTVNVLAGPGGSGKSFLGYDLAARVSQGREMPDGSPGALPSNVVIVGLEDSPEASAVHRLTAAQADLSRVFDASETPSGKPFDLTENLPWLREVIDQIGGARLVIIDTLSAASPVSLTAVATVRRKLLIPPARLRPGHRRRCAGAAPPDQGRRDRGLQGHRGRRAADPARDQG